MAITLGLPLCTIDKNLADAAEREGVPLVLKQTKGKRGKK